MDDSFYQALYDVIINSYIDEMQMQRLSQTKELINSRNEVLKMKKSELSKLEKELRKIYEAYLADAYTPVEYAKLKKGIEEGISLQKSEIYAMESDNNDLKTSSKSELRRKISSFKRQWQNAITNREKNLLLRTIVNKIYYDRDCDNITFEIEYL